MNGKPLFNSATALVLAVSLLGSMRQADGTTIKFMTYNVQSPGWNQDRRAQVVETIDSELPDVLGLHEVSASGNGADLMANLMDDYEPYLTVTTEPMGWRGNAGRSLCLISAVTLKRKGVCHGKEASSKKTSIPPNV